MLKRSLYSTLKERLDTFSSVALLGPRQIGKTTLALDLAEERQSVYLDLENLADIQKIADFRLFYNLNKDSLIILDEVQRAPEVFKEIRGIIDQARREGRRTGIFLFLGSASLDLLRQSSESLAGRISYLELQGINVLEYDDTANLWFRGGFPESVLAQTEEIATQWRRDFIKTYLERDIPQLGFNASPTTMERLWTMLAHNQGTPLNASKLAMSLEVSNMSVTRYTDLLVDLLLVRKVEPYFFNTKKRLVKSPRLYIRDSGILHSLLNIRSINELLGNPVVGKSWEGFVIENIASVLPIEAKLYYYRTARGAELDLLIEFSPAERWAIEIKKGQIFSIGKGFYEACEDVRASRKMVIYGGESDYPISEEVMVYSLKSFLKQVIEIK